MRLALAPCGSWPASEGGLRADQPPTARTQSTVGASLLAKAAYEPTHLQQPTPNPTVGAGLPAIATSQPPSFFQVYSMPMSAALRDRHRAAANRATGCCRAVVVFHSVARDACWRGKESVDPGRCRWQASSHSWIGCGLLEVGRLGGRLREQASSHSGLGVGS